MFQFVTKKTMLTDVLGRELPAVTVFSKAISYIMDQAVSALCKRDSLFDIKTITIQWVVTVPAIWSDVSKQFMRFAATEVIFNIIHR